jgi:hypothetical protein
LGGTPIFTQVIYQTVSKSWRVTLEWIYFLHSSRYSMALKLFCVKSSILKMFCFKTNDQISHHYVLTPLHCWWKYCTHWYSSHFSAIRMSRTYLVIQSHLSHTWTCLKYNYVHKMMDFLFSSHITLVILGKKLLIM